MFTRRLILAGLGLALAGTVHAQSQKSAGIGSDVSRSANVAGLYTAVGLNKDGSAYGGLVDIKQQGDAVDFTWQIAKETFRGHGRITGRVVTVDWGDTNPVIYVIMEDGELHGTWDDGQALEKLIPQ